MAPAHLCNRPSAGLGACLQCVLLFAPAQPAAVSPTLQEPIRSAFFPILWIPPSSSRYFSRLPSAHLRTSSIVFSTSLRLAVQGLPRAETPFVCAQTSQGGMFSSPRTVESITDFHPFYTTPASCAGA